MVMGHFGAQLDPVQQTPEGAVHFLNNSLVDIPEKVEVDYIRSFILFSC